MDLTVKLAAVLGVARLLGAWQEYLPHALSTCLPLLQQRLGNELTRDAAMRALHALALHRPLLDLSPILADCVVTLLGLLRKGHDFR